MQCFLGHVLIDPRTSLEVFLDAFKYISTVLMDIVWMY